MKQNTFRELEAYKEGKKLVKEVYRLLKLFPKEERYAICDQLRRSVISVTSNIAEGSGRASYSKRYPLNTKLKPSTSEYYKKRNPIT